MEQYKKQKGFLDDAKEKRLEQTNIIRKIKKDKTIHMTRMSHGRATTVDNPDKDSDVTHRTEKGASPSIKTVHDLPSLASTILIAKTIRKQYETLHSIRVVLESLDGNMHPFFAQGPSLLDKIYECTTLGLGDRDSVLTVYESTRIIAIVTSSDEFAGFVGAKGTFVNHVITNLITVEYTQIVYNALRILSNVFINASTYFNCDDKYLGNCIIRAITMYAKRSGFVVLYNQDDGTVCDGTVHDVLGMFGDVLYTIARMPFTCYELSTMSKDEMDAELRTRKEMTDAKFKWCTMYIVKGIQYLFMYERSLHACPRRDDSFSSGIVTAPDECMQHTTATEFKIYALEALYTVFRSSASRTNCMILFRDIISTMNRMVYHTAVCKSYKHYMLARSVLRVISCATYHGVNTDLLSIFVRNNIIDYCLNLCELVVCSNGHDEDEYTHELDKDAAHGCKHIAFEIIENISTDDKFHMEMLGIGKRTIFRLSAMWKKSLYNSREVDVQTIASILRNVLCMCVKDNMRLISLVADYMVNESKLLSNIRETLVASTKTGTREKSPVVSSCVVILYVLANNGYSSEVCNDTMCEVLEDLQFSCDKCSFDVICELLSMSHANEQRVDD